MRLSSFLLLLVPVFSTVPLAHGATSYAYNTIFATRASTIGWNYPSNEPWIWSGYPTTGIYCSDVTVETGMVGTFLERFVTVEGDYETNAEVWAQGSLYMSNDPTTYPTVTLEASAEDWSNGVVFKMQLRNPYDFLTACIGSVGGGLDCQPVTWMAINNDSYHDYRLVKTGNTWTGYMDGYAVATLQSSWNNNNPRITVAGDYVEGLCLDWFHVTK